MVLDLLLAEGIAEASHPAVWVVPPLPRARPTVPLTISTAHTDGAYATTPVVTNDVVLTTTFRGDLYALNAATGAILFKTPMSAGSNAPVAVDGDYVIAGAGAALSSTQRDMIIAYKLGATGKLPDTVGA